MRLNTVDIVIEKCDNERTTTPTRQGDGRFTYVLSEEQAMYIDACKCVVLHTNFAVVRATLVRHFSTVSLESLERDQVVAQAPSEIHSKPYRVNGEARRITSDTHYVEQDGIATQLCTARPEGTVSHTRFQRVGAGAWGSNSLSGNRRIPMPPIPTHRNASVTISG